MNTVIVMTDNISILFKTTQTQTDQQHQIQIDENKVALYIFYSCSVIHNT